MQTQSDSKVRVVSISNLEAMCQQVSGHCHVYRVSKVSRSRVHVEYSNPSEYGSARPIYAVFPCYGENVVLDYLNVLEGNDKSLAGEGWQSFEVLRDAPVMFRGPDGKWNPFVPNPQYPKDSPKAYIPMLSTCVCGSRAEWSSHQRVPGRILPRHVRGEASEKHSGLTQGGGLLVGQCVMVGKD